MAKKLVSFTHGNKAVIDWDNIGIALTKEEKVIFTRLLGKLIEFDMKKEMDKGRE